MLFFVEVLKGLQKHLISKSVHMPCKQKVQLRIIEIISFQAKGASWQIKMFTGFIDLTCYSVYKVPFGCKRALTACLAWIYWLFNEGVLIIPLLGVLDYYHSHNSRHVYIFGMYSVLLLQQSHRSAVNVSLEIMPRATSICGHECCHVALYRDRTLYGGAKIGSLSPACNSCLFNLACKVSCSLSPGLHYTELVPYISCAPNICLAPMEYLKQGETLFWWLLQLLGHLQDEHLSVKPNAL